MSDGILPFVSVILPTRNRADMVGQAVSDLLVQDYPPDRYEVILVDDGSTDATIDFGAALTRRSELPRTRVVRQAPSGLNPARNAGITAAVGDPIILVDDDVRVPPGWLGQMVGALRRHPGPVCVGGKIVLELEKTPKTCGRHSIGESELDLGPDEHRVELVWGANLGMWREALRLAGLFDERLRCGGDDTEWERRLARVGGLVYYSPDAWLWHRRRAADMKVPALIRRSYLRGRLCGLNVTYTEDPMSYPTTLRRIVGYLQHAVRHRCCVGLVYASLASGCLAGQFEGTIRRVTAHGRTQLRTKCRHSALPPERRADYGPGPMTGDIEY